MGSHGNPATNPQLHDVSSYHAHGKSYMRTAAILTIITIFEIAILYVPQIPHDLLPPMMIGMAVVKFAMVVGLFMHLADDANIFKLVFIAPLFMALAMILVTGLMVSQHWDVYEKTYARLFTNKSKLERVDPDKYFAASAAKPAKSAEEYEKMFAGTKDFSAGEKVFASKCVACHGKNGEGMSGLGPNMTDDCYKNGGTVYDFVNVLTNGVKGTAMVAMIGSQLTAEEGEQVALYVRSLRGKNVPGGKDCEGEKVK